MNLKSGTQWYKKSLLSLQTPPNDDNKNPVSAADLYEAVFLQRLKV